METQAAPALGICRDALCVGAGLGPVERYEGAGMFCPNCGELLQAYEPTPVPPPPERVAEPAPGHSSPPPLPPSAPARLGQPAPARAVVPSLLVRRLFVWVVVLAVVTGAIIVCVPGILDRSRGAASAAVGVCGTNLTDRIAGDIADAYSAQPQAEFKSFELRSANCDVRFFATLDQRGSGSITSAVGSFVARDGIVAIVNPQNPLTSLSMNALRQILSGSARDWSRFGGASGPITVYLPDVATDESRIVTAALLKGAPVGSSVIRVGSSRDVVRAVAAANGRNAIGMVAFSVAEPGKVLAIQHFPPPSIISIGDRRYPIVLSIRAWSNGGALPEFMTFATSSSAKAVAVRDGLIP